MELSVISFSNQSKIIRQGNTRIVLIKSRKIYYLFPFLAILKLFHEIKKTKIDIIHLQGSNFSPYLIVTDLLKSRYPTLVIVLGLVSKEARYREGVGWHFYSFFNRIAEKYIITKSKNIVVETESIKKIVSKWTQANIYVVPSGVDFNKLQEIRSIPLSEKPDIFVASRLEKLKGIDLLIKATSIIINEFPSLRVFIAGTGPDEKELKVLVKRLNLENHIRFLGFISNEEKYQYYDACKFVVIPSRWDCQPIALFEAAASGKPVIASDMSNPEIVIEGETGLIFKSENVNDLIDKMILLLKNPEVIEKIGKNAQENVKKYDWSEIGKKFAEIYNEVIKDFYKQNVNGSE
jgi:glycosyltransferase involved in cell wall biosynthesis